MEAVCSSEMMVTFYQATWHNIPRLFNKSDRKTDVTKIL
jgi:hypothetical protein